MSKDSRRKKRALKFLVLGAAGAGKTSLLRRYFYHQFDLHRAPTVGADFYVGCVGEQRVRIQMWDTPGKELSFAAYQTTMDEAFFQQADAIMLVYDMTSSTSFTRMLKWYADLVELFAGTGHPIPILLVANKLDLFEKGSAGQPPPARVPQRDVLGLGGKYFKGKTYQYEYSVSSSRHRVPPPKQQRNNKRRMEMSSYLVNRDNWTTDGSYLESLIHSEDGSHPDHEMVKLWCMRNALSLYEGSAATGQGVDRAIQALVNLALSSDLNDIAEPSNNNRKRNNSELDLQRRYGPKNGKGCFSLPLIRNFV